MTSIMTPSLHIYLKNNPAKFHPDLIRNDGALGFFEEVAPTGRRTTTTQQQQQDELWYEISSWSKSDKNIKMTQQKRLVPV